MALSQAPNAEARRSLVAENILGGQAECLRQKAEIRQIATENEKIKKEIASVTGEPYDYVKADKFATLKAEVDALERRYQFEKMKRNELMKKYQLARIDLLQSRRLKGGVNAEKEHAEAIQRQVEILENRLDQALTKFNDAIAYNKELRDHIDIIREERRVFQRVYKRMEDDLTTKKKLMSERIEQSNKDLDERDEYLRQVELLRQAIQKQKQEYDASVLETDAAMVEIKEMREEQQQLQLELESREYEFESGPENPISPQVTQKGLGFPSALVVAETGVSTGATHDAFAEGIPSDTPLETEPDMKDVLHHIAEFSPDADLQDLVRRYEQLGESNFTLYKRVNELTTSKGDMEREIRNLRANIEEEKACEARQREMIKELEARLADTEEKLDGLLHSIAEHHDALSSVREVTEDIFRLIGCSAAAVGSDHCTESNHLQFLGLIEERAGLVMYAFQRRQRLDALRAELSVSSQQQAQCRKELRVGDAGGESISILETLGAPRDEEDGAEAQSKQQILPRVDDIPIEAMSLTRLPSVPPPRDGTSAARLVRQSCLPSAHLGGDEGGDVVEEWDGDPIVSHQAIRKQMEQRLYAKREREERAMRRKRDLKEQHNAPLSPRKK